MARNVGVTRWRRFGYRPLSGPGYTRRVGVFGRFQPGGVERKWFDETTAAVTVTTAGIVNQTINPIPQGAGQSERVGAKCVLTNIMVRGAVNLAPAGVTTASDRVRCILYLDKQNNGTGAAVTDILQTASVDSFNNLFNADRFVILKDVYVDITTEAGAVGGFVQSTETFQMYKTCRIPIEWNGATGALAEIRSNNIGLLFISENGAATVEYVSRLRFVDP